MKNPFKRENPHLVKRRSERWRSINPERHRIHVMIVNARRRLIKGTDDTLTPDDWLALLKQYGHRCGYCLKEGILLELDHKVPLSRGGANTKDNAIPACRECNASKGDKTQKEWTNGLVDAPTQPEDTSCQPIEFEKPAVANGDQSVDHSLPDLPSTIPAKLSISTTVPTPNILTT